MGVIASPEQNATGFTLCSDAFFGNSHVFSGTIFNETRAYWTGPILTAEMLANSKIARQTNSKAYNPSYRFSPKTEQFSLGEVAAPVIAFGDIKTGTANRKRTPSHGLGMEKANKSHNPTGYPQRRADDTECNEPDYPFGIFRVYSPSGVLVQLAFRGEDLIDKVVWQAINFSEGKFGYILIDQGETFIETYEAPGYHVETSINI
ncbi:hypothetical protein NUU61_001243 [Penicillium alfredii]|uniref:Heme haloperoxidase family profile domain-containing protein n=1 Tax=Penicillium alfredii TaxID=1506179 RepID=A0A9W9KQH2_9EURO|nr:uncharacterized protein NUU61_001243 [Penicillium alfredii]KAJ5115484.1 hypothetical protein NUU61_001243 [Penicillium alfredii]